ncbi:AAWKG family protein [Streptomyces sp. AM 2-1-1]|uniref:AAWKG family protein n=1 Tax=Streptomyces sp. AM 2-1-1 TaxID=3028709 RepID=UPI0023BA2CCD|nr:AAWKG family protein [Streptomyces sp. AM 2-1-1]WEH43416.1 AAWKG family protein [Streptomyces sp. AM 2-1-1]
MSVDGKTNNDYWKDAVTLLTGYPLEGQDKIFDSLKGNDDIPLMHVEIKSAGSLHDLLNDGSGGWRKENTDFVVPFMVDSGSSVSFRKAYITLLVTYDGKVPDGATRFEGGVVTSKVHKKGKDYESYDTTRLAQYAQGAGDALQALLDPPYSTQGFVNRGLSVSDEQAVDLLSLTRVARSFERVVEFFEYAARETENWENTVVGEGNESWQGTGASLFRALVHKLRRNYEGYVSQLGKGTRVEAITLDNYWLYSLAGRSLAQAQVEIHRAVQSLHTAWKAWEPMSSPQRWVYDMLLDARIALLDQIDHVEPVVPISTFGYPQAPYWEATPGFFEDLTFGGTTYGPPKEMATWKKLGDEAVKRWRDAVDNALGTAGADAIVAVNKALSAAKDGFDKKLTDRDGTSLSETLTSDKSKIDERKAEEERKEAEKERERAKAEAAAAKAEYEKDKAEAKAEAEKEKAEAKAEQAAAKAEAEREKAEARAEAEKEKAAAKAEQEAAKAEAEKEKAEAKAEQEAAKAEAKAEQAAAKAEAENAKAEAKAEQEAAKTEAKAEQEAAKAEAEKEKAEAEQRYQQDKAEAEQEKTAAKAEAEQQQLLVAQQQAAAKKEAEKERERATAEQDAAKAEAEQEKAAAEAEQEAAKAEARAQQDAAKTEADEEKAAAKAEQDAAKAEARAQQDAAKTEADEEKAAAKAEQDAAKAEARAQQDAAKAEAEQEKAAAKAEQDAAKAGAEAERAAAQGKADQVQADVKAEQDAARQTAEREKFEAAQQASEDRAEAQREYEEARAQAQEDRAAAVDDARQQEAEARAEYEKERAEADGLRDDARERADSERAAARAEYDREIADGRDQSDARADYEKQLADIDRREADALQRADDLEEQARADYQEAKDEARADRDAARAEAQRQIAEAQADYDGRRDEIQAEYDRLTADDYSRENYLQDRLDGYTASVGTSAGPLADGLLTDGSPFTSDFSEGTFANDYGTLGGPSASSAQSGQQAPAQQSSSPMGPSPHMPRMGGGENGNAASERTRSVIGPATSRSRGRGAIRERGTEENTVRTGSVPVTSGSSPFLPPMAGGGASGGRQQQTQSADRERNAWITEDEDVWGTDEGGAPQALGR